VPQIEVTFDIDANGCVNVGASDKSTGKKQAITIQSSGGLSDADIERMVQEAESMKEEDAKKKEGVTAKNDAETFIHTVEKQMSEFGDKISSEDKTDLNTKMSAVRTALEGDDVDAIKAAKDELQQASWKVSQQMYQSGSSEEGASSEGSTEEPKKEEQQQQEERK